MSGTRLPPKTATTVEAAASHATRMHQQWAQQQAAREARKAEKEAAKMDPECVFSPKINRSPRRRRRSVQDPVRALMGSTAGSAPGGGPAVGAGSVAVNGDTPLPAGYDMAMNRFRKGLAERASSRAKRVMLSGALTRNAPEELFGQAPSDKKHAHASVDADTLSRLYLENVYGVAPAAAAASLQQQAGAVPAASSAAARVLSPAPAAAAAKSPTKPGSKGWTGQLVQAAGMRQSPRDGASAAAATAGAPSPVQVRSPSVAPLPPGGAPGSPHSEAGSRASRTSDAMAPSSWEALLQHAMRSS